jgi:putative YhbY family RNA-binding protein
MPLTPSRRSELRAQAHTLSPVVIIGDKGLTDVVIAEIDRSLKSHELIKVRCAGGERGDRDQWMAAICAKLDAQPVQQIGKILVVYRENFDKPRVKARMDPVPVPRERGGRDDKSIKRVARKRGGADDKDVKRVARNRGGAVTQDVKRTSLPRSRTPSARPESEPRRRRPRSSR